MIIEEIPLWEEGSLEGSKLRVYIQDYSEKLRIKKRPLILICPGGGYSYTSDREAEPLALEFMARGFNAAVLRYSCSPAVFPTAILELGRSILIIRENAEKWNIKSDAIILQGSSAGGHVAASFACFFRKKFVARGLGIEDKDDIEKLTPNGLMLSYPVITSGVHAHRESFVNLLGDKYDELLDRVSLETAVNEYVPRTFIWHTFTDASVPVENSLLFATALKENGINTELHIFPEGCHGLALANEVTSGDEGKEIVPVCEPWIDLAGSWLKKYL